MLVITATALRVGVEASLWAAPIAWSLARAVATALPLESVREAAGRAHEMLGYAATCVPCLSAWFALIPAIVVGREAGAVTGAACWAGAWAGALLLDATHDRLRSGSSRGQAEFAPTDWTEACFACSQSLAGEPEANVVIVVSAARRSLRFSHRKCRA